MVDSGRSVDVRTAHARQIYTTQISGFNTNLQFNMAHERWNEGMKDRKTERRKDGVGGSCNNLRRKRSLYVNSFVVRVLCFRKCHFIRSGSRRVTQQAMVRKLNKRAGDCRRQSNRSRDIDAALHNYRIDVATLPAVNEAHAEMTSPADDRSIA